MSAPTTVLRIALTLPEGGASLSREFTMIDAPGPLDDPPPFLTNARRTWDRPQDPVLLTGDVVPGREDEAREWLEAL